MFNFESHNVRTVVDDKGELWFVAKDVCDALGLADASQAVSRLDEDEKLLRVMYASGQNRGLLTMNESGLFKLVVVLHFC